MTTLEFADLSPHAGELTAEDDRWLAVVAEIDPRRMDEVRRNWPFLRDRRIDAYGPLTNRWIG